ncbi:MAG TPA: fumarylacetoacetate hydrolase family protein [Dongiaceae bacterium]|jgi:2-oxo-3-hexenedioate decarboxylase/2-keto-4-pentenoate hydratase|nr:fumarylacetoacetate hydrolase family protein [Dongiaceae bacterium]
MPGFNPDAAARTLASARLEHRAVSPLPAGVAPADAAAGYAVQGLLHELLSAAGEGALAGHKIGCTTKVMREKLGIDQPCAGRIHARRLLASGGRWTVAGLIKPSVECEIAVRLGRDLPPIPRYYTAANMRSAVESCMASIELCDDRYTDREAVGVPTLIADDFYNVGCALGHEVTGWQSIDLAAIGGAMRINGRETGRGKGSDIMDHPLNALAWLANLRASEGRHLKAGEFVTLGSIVSSQRVAAGDQVEIEIESLGGISLAIE